MPDHPLISHNEGDCINPDPRPSENDRQNAGKSDVTGGAAPAHKSWAEDLFHEDWPKAKYYHDRNCPNDHELRCDLDLQLNHFECWGSERQAMLEKLYRKVTYEFKDGRPGYWNRQRQWRNYDWQATTVALSTYENRERFCNCGFHGYSCGDPLCLRCCYKDRAEPELIEFGQALHSDDECYYLVLSLSREPDEQKRLIFRTLTDAEQEEIKIKGRTQQDSRSDYGIKFKEYEIDRQCQAYWRIFAKVVHQFTGNKIKQFFSGAFGGPELSVRFLPLAVLPHANYIVWSPGLSVDNLRELRKTLRRRFRNSRITEAGVYPKVSAYRLKTVKDYQAVIRYAFKPIDIGYAYAVVAAAVNCEPAALARLNRQTDIFLENLDLIFYEVHRITRFGFCWATSRDYVGIVSPERKLRRRRDRQRRRLKQKESREIREYFPAYRPFRRKRTAKSREDLHSMRRWYRRLVREGELPGKPPKRWLRKRKQSSRSAAPGGACSKCDPSCLPPGTARE